MTDRKLAWQALGGAAKAWVAREEAVEAQALAQAAEGWCLAKGWKPPAAPGAAKPGGDLVLTFSRSKGKTIAEADTKDLQWIAERVRENLDNPEKARFRAKDQSLLEAIEAELESR